MYLKIFFKFILVVFLVILQLAFVSNLPFYSYGLNLIIVFLIFSLELDEVKNNIWWFFLIGFLFDNYSSLPFGFWLIVWPLIFMLTKILAKNFFTNQSLYSFLGLTFFSSLFYYLLYYFGINFWNKTSGEKEHFFLFLPNFWLSLLVGLIANVIVVSLVFYLVNLLTNRLKPVFLFKN